MSFSTILTRPSDELAHLAVITSADEDPDFPSSLLVDDLPAKTAKLLTTSGYWLLDNGAAVDAREVAIIHPSFDAGLTVRVQRNATDSWGSPTMDATIVVPPWSPPSGVNRWPYNLRIDLTLVAGYNPAGFRYTRIGTGAVNSSNIEVGQVKLYSDRLVLDRGILWGEVAGNTYTLRRPYIRNTTRFEVETTYGIGTVLWEKAAQFYGTDAMRQSLIDQWHDAGGGASPWVLIPRSDESSCYLVKWADDRMEVPNYATDVHPMKLVVKEVARGLRPGA